MRWHGHLIFELNCTCTDKIDPISLKDLAKIVKRSSQDHWKILSKSYQELAASWMILQDLFHNYLAGSYQRSCQDYLAMISPRSCQDLTKVLSKLMECHNRQTMQMLCLSFIFCPFASFAWRESVTHEHAILMPWYFCMN